MHTRRLKSAHTFIRSLLLLFVLTQSMLLLHEIDHTAHHADSECQLCLQAHSGGVPGQCKITLVNRNAAYHGIPVQPSNLPLQQTPVNTRHSRAPPQV